MSGAARSVARTRPSRAFSLLSADANAAATNNEFISAIESAVGKKAIREYLPMQPGDVKETLADISPLNRKIGFLRHEVDLTNTIINMIKAEQVHDVQERMVERLDNQILRGNDDLG